MIDISSKVIDTVANSVITSYPSAFVTGEYVDVPPSFPCVTISEDNNSTYEKTLDDTNDENHVSVTYTINVFSAKESGKRAECMSVAEICDTQMRNMGFLCTQRGQIQNIDPSVFRYIMRYTAVVAKPITVDGQQVYGVYKK